MIVADYWLVEAEFKRIQTYLFAVPRLPVMVGANARLGETLRGLWRDDHFAGEPRSLPALARQCGARWPDQATGEHPRSAAQSNDPLIWENVWQDDVEAVARQTGVLTRDAGHFEAVFPAEDKAREFVRQARELVEERLPGVLLEVRFVKLAHDGHIFRRQPAELPGPVLDGMVVLDFPQAEVCQYSGQEPASERIKEPGVDEVEVRVGGSVEGRRQHGRDFDQGKTRDILGILRPILLRDLGCEGNNDAFPTAFSQLAINGYLAVIHVDGNSVGSRFRAYQAQQTSDDFFAQWRHREAFYHTLRLGVRRAVCRALRETFSGWRTRQSRVPLRLLMLGGDDLVLVCGAPFGLPFVVALAQAVRETTGDLPSEDEEKPAPLTLGAGVAIVQDSFPFHRAYELAEDLASSAKRLKSSLPAGDGNVVDWIVTSEAWHGDIAATRYDHFVIDNKLILSAKPYRVLEPESGEGTGQSLETMLQDARDLAELTREDRVARSQLQGLARSLPRGQHTARFAAEILPRGLHEALEKKHYLSRKDGPWVPLPDGQRHLSRVLDLLELYELEILRQEAEQTRALIRDTDRRERDS